MAESGDFFCFWKTAYELSDNGVTELHKCNKEDSN